jgi:ATP-dependent helicase HrpA
MMMMGLGDIENFPFLDPPDSRLVNDGFRQLAELAAIDEKRRLTPLGRKLGQLPVDPRLARILVQASRERALAEVLVMVSALSIQDVRENPADKREAAREKHQRFADEHSDFAALFNLWNYLEAQRQELGSNAFRKMCGKEFLSFLRVREWRETHAQLKRICQEIGLQENDTPAGFDAIHRSLLAGSAGECRVPERAEDFRRHAQPQVRHLPRVAPGEETAEVADGSRADRNQPAVCPPDCED